MRASLHLLILLVSALPLFGQVSSAPAAGGRSFTLVSVSRPGCHVAEAKSLCLVTKDGAPLRLKLAANVDHPQAISLESEANPGYFLRHQDSRLKLHPYAEGDWVFAADSAFFLINNPDGTVSFRSYNYPKQYISVTSDNELYIATDPELPSRSFKIVN